MVELLFKGGPIITMQRRRPRVEALLVRDEKVVALGSLDELRPQLSRHVQEFDLQGRCLVPGFHDAHLHLGQHGLELFRLQLHDSPSLEDALAKVAAGVRSLPAGAWLLGSGFSMGRWGLGQLTHEMLDAVSQNHPVFLQSQDHHSGWLNTLALEKAGIDAGTPDPQDGAIVRVDGRPSGVLLERAMDLVRRVIPAPDEAALRGAVRAAGENLAGLGITTVHHMAFETPASWRHIGLSASREDYPLRVWSCIPQEDAEHAAAVGLATGQGGSRFWIGGAKFFADGALGSRTARMLEPYQGSSERGLTVHGPEVLRERLPVVIEAGLSPVIHAIGDEANRFVIDELARTRAQWQARGMRPRVEHAQHLHPDDVPRFAALGLTVSAQPLHLSFDASHIRRMMPERQNGAYRFRSLLKAGAVLAFGSDTPVASPDVLQGVRAACTRCDLEGRPFNSEERLGVGAALAAYTSGAAYAIGREGHSGRLSPGFDADLTLLSHDPFESLDRLEVEGTMLAGRWTYGGT